MPLKFAFGALSTILSFVSFIPYVRGIYAKRTEPHAYSWLIWVLLQGTAAFAMATHGALYAAVAMSAGGLVSLLVFVLALRFGTKNITAFDTVCLIGALAAIAVWAVQNDPLISVILVTLIDFVGYIPTYRKGYAEPWSETAALYALAIGSNVFTVLAIQSYSLTTTLYAASLIVTNSIFVSILVLRRRQVARPNVQ